MRHLERVMGRSERFGSKNHASEKRQSEIVPSV